MGTALLLALNMKVITTLPIRGIASILPCIHMITCPWEAPAQTIYKHKVILFLFLDRSTMTTHLGLECAYKTAVLLAFFYDILSVNVDRELQVMTPNARQNAGQDAGRSTGCWRDRYIYVRQDTRRCTTLHRTLGARLDAGANAARGV